MQKMYRHLWRIPVNPAQKPTSFGLPGLSPESTLRHPLNNKARRSARLCLVDYKSTYALVQDGTSGLTGGGGQTT